MTVNNRRYVRILVILALLSVGWIPAAGQSVQRIASPDGVFYYQPAASVFGTEAAWVNPAGLGRYTASSFQVIGDYFDGNIVKSWGFVTQAERLTTTFRRVKNPAGDDYSEWIFGAGVPLGASATIGSAYSYYSEGPGFYRHLHSWTVGVQGQGQGVVSWGAVFSNLNRAIIDGNRTEIEQRYSLAYRPTGQKVTLSADMFLSTKTKFKNAEYVYQLEYVPVDGFFIDGLIDSHRNFGVGVRVNLINYFAGFKSRFTRKANGLGTSLYVGVTNLRQPSIIAQPKRLLAVNIEGQGLENPPQPVFGRKPMSYATVLFQLYRAAQDPSISRVLVQLGDLRLGMGKAQELREAILQIRSNHKRVICYVSDPRNLSYYIASAADSILIPTVSMLELVGLRTELTFYAGTLEKLGVKIDMVQIGDYKSAAETYTRKSASEANREQANRLLDDIYDQFVSAIADGRHLTADSVKRAIDSGPFTSVKAKDAGLVDGVCYPDELEQYGFAGSRLISLDSYIRDTLVNYDWGRKPVLAVVVAEGEITDDNAGLTPLSRSGGVTPSPFQQALSRAEHDPRVKGIVLRIDSPGGGALASDAIYRSAKLASERKPFVVSMGGVAASGGYYIAMPADRVFADPATITGSIGIFGGKADLSGLYKKIDLNKELLTRGKFSAMMSMIRPFTDEERAKYFEELKAFYDHFVELVSGNRRLTADSVNHLGAGRVWTGREALYNGLVDELGGLQQTLEYTANRLGIADRYTVDYYPRRRPLFILPAQPFWGFLAGLFVQRGGRSEDTLSDLLPLAGETVYARLPYDITIE